MGRCPGFSESALTYGDWDINENWQHYKDAFLRGQEDE